MNERCMGLIGHKCIMHHASFFALKRYVKFDVLLIGKSTMLNNCKKGMVLIALFVKMLYKVMALVKCFSLTLPHNINSKHKCK